MEEREEERRGGVVARSHSDLNTCRCWVGVGGRGGGGGTGGEKEGDQVYSSSLIEHYRWTSCW